MNGLPTIDLKNLDGIWKTFYGRRLALHADADAAVLKVWRGLSVQADSLVAVARAALGETAVPVDPDVVVSAAAALSAVRNDTELAEVISLWIRQAEAEGRTGALALAADSADASLQFDWELAFEDAYAAFDDLELINAEALSALDAAITGTSRDLGRTLGTLVRDGASYDDLIRAVEDVFLKASSASYWVDTAMSAAMSQGAINLYTSEGVATVDWITAGDDRVCAECEGNEQGNPWSLNGNLPTPPQHGKCRCCLSANQSLPESVYAPYLGDAGLE